MVQVRSDLPTARALALAIYQVAGLSNYDEFEVLTDFTPDRSWKRRTRFDVLVE